MSFFDDISAIAQSYALADETPYTSTGDRRTIRRVHMAQALTSTDNAASRLLAEAGFRPTDPPLPPYDAGGGSFTIAPEVGNDMNWISGLRTGLGGRPDPSLCWLVKWLTGTDNLDKWLRTRGADTDLVCRRLVEALSLPEPICTRRVRWADEAVSLPAAEGEAMARELRAQGLLYGWNRKEDGTVVIVPEHPESPRLS